MGLGASRYRNSLLLCACLAALGAHAQSNEEELLFKSAGDVNEGPLHFLTSPPDTSLYHFRNQVIITDSSLKDGWVGIFQCHDNLDAVPSLQIVYGPDKIRRLQIHSSQEVGRSWVEANSVQAQDLRPGASLCVSAESRALAADEFGTGFILKNGPYMRQFLDGYYPMRASLTIRLETDKLRFIGSQPAPQAGFRLWQGNREIGYDAHFEGSLRTELRFDLLRP